MNAANFMETYDYDLWSLKVINVKNFHRSLTTVVRAQNDTSETVDITDTIFNRKSDNS